MNTMATGWPGTLDTLRESAAAAHGAPVSFLSFTIAGIQDFIAASRTTRDVWNGSYLLSWLCFNAARSIAGSIKSAKPWAACIFPDAASQALVKWDGGTSANPQDLSIANFPNTMLFVVPAGLDEARAIAVKAEQSAARAWETIRKTVWEVLDGSSLKRSDYAAGQWRYQTAFHRVFECYWSVMVVPQDETGLRELAADWNIRDEFLNDYAAAIQTSARILQSRKMLRDFDQVGEEGYRCSLCGARAALADYGSRARNRLHQLSRGRFATVVSSEVLTDFWNALRKHPRLHRRIDENERLCAICLIRRLAPHFYFNAAETVDAGLPGYAPRQLKIDADFPPTSSFAVADFLAYSHEELSTDAEVIRAIRKFNATFGEVDIEIAKILPRTRNSRLQVLSFPLPGLKRRIQDPDSPWHTLFSIDGSFLYPEKWTPRAIAAELGDRELAKTFSPELMKTLDDNPAKQLLGVFHRQMPPGTAFREPSSYFAVLCSDGDHMGNWITGAKEEFENGSVSFDPAFQKTLSRGLAQFAAAARKAIEEEFFGKVVYAGGDDLLAFLPVRHALPAMLRLRGLFNDLVAMACGLDGLITLSISCVAARHSEPLSGAIEGAQKLLKDAKVRYGRPAFAWRRTTGGGTETGSTLAMADGVLDDVATVQNAFESGLASPRIIYELAGLTMSLSEWDSSEEQALHGARASLLKKAVLEHVQDRLRSPAEVTDAQSAFRKLFDDLYAWEGRAQYKNRQKPDAWTTMIDLMDFAHFLLRGSKQ